MYELFILGELIDQPMHGYLLREVISMAIGPLRQMSWGALYPLLRRMETDGLIEQTPDPTVSSERPRKVYRITDEGRERFIYLMLRPEEPHPDQLDLFNIKLVNFDHLTVPQREELVRDYREQVQFVQSELIKARRFVSTEKHIAEPEKRWILISIEHRLHLLDADLQWIERLEGMVAG